MEFTEDERSCLRYYLGRSDYDRVERCNEFEELEQALLLLTIDGRDKVRAILCKLQDIDKRLCDALDCLTVEMVDDAKLRSPGQVINTLRSEGKRLAKSLAVFLSVTLKHTPFGPVGARGHVLPRG